MTADDVARDLHCSSQHVLNLIHGKVKDVRPIPHLKLGRKYVVRRSSLEAWKREVETGRLPDTQKSEAVGAVH
jgi:excisionase family DNA binding protein